MNSVIQAEGLSKRFEMHAAVSGLTLDVREGEILALLGPNGAGKTTTVRMLTSILRPTGGWARVAGFDIVREPRRVREHVGHLTELPGLYLRMRPLEYLDFFGELQGMPKALRRSRSEKLLAEFGLEEASRRRLGEFSKGMRQKVALVRALLHEPRAVFLDEPTSAMDPHSAKQVRDAIVRLREAGQTVLLCTHNLNEAENLADRIAIIRHGRLVALGTASELKDGFLGPPVMKLELVEPLQGPWPELGEANIVEQSPVLLRYRTIVQQRTNPELVERLTARGARVLTLAAESRSLEQVYLRLIGDEEQAARVLAPAA